MCLEMEGLRICVLQNVTACYNLLATKILVGIIPLHQHTHPTG